MRTDGDAPWARRTASRRARYTVASVTGPDALQAAVSLAGDKRHPFRAAAADVLGSLCDPGAGAAALRALAASSDPSLARTAERAQKRCTK